MPVRRKRRVLAPGQLAGWIVEPGHGMAVEHALQYAFQIGKGLDAAELGGFDQGAGSGPAGSAAIGAGEQVVLAVESDGPNGPLDGIVVDLDPAIVEEATQGRPAGESVADRFARAPRSGMRLSPVSSQGRIGRIPHSGQAAA